jgi:hypothetical protein
MRRELVPATHRAELRGGDGIPAVELVDRRVDPLSVRSVLPFTVSDISPKET